MLELYQFEASINPRPAAVLPGEPALIDGRPWATLDPPSSDLGTFACSFEELAAEMEGWPRMFLEPDGSFVWVSNDAACPWQLDGLLVDRGGRLLFVELKGSCPKAALDQMLTALGWPTQPVLLHLTRAGVYLDEAEFRRWAQSAGSSATEPPGGPR